MLTSILFFYETSSASFFAALSAFASSFEAAMDAFIRFSSSSKSSGLSRRRLRTASLPCPSLVSPYENQDPLFLIIPASTPRSIISPALEIPLP